MPLEKSSIATHFCKVCFKDESASDLASVFKNYPICSKCFFEMSPRYKVSKIAKVRVYSLYVYNEKVKTMLYQLKGCFDIEISEVFLSRQKSFLKRKYKDWFLVPAPSYSKKNEIRGFNHVEEIFKCIDRPFLSPIKKIDNVKQADLNFEERQRIGEHLSWNESVSVKDLKILFVDDLLTTGATARACIKMLQDHGARKIEVLVMARAQMRKKSKTKFYNAFAQKLLQIKDIFRKNR